MNELLNRFLPQHYKERYTLEPKSFKDVPGWINDAEGIYPQMVREAKDGYHFVEIGTLLGQSATHMAQLIKDSGKDIKFDSIDLFWTIKHHIQVAKTEPLKTFKLYIDDIEKKWGIARIMEIVQHPLRVLGLLDYVNFITCDEKYAHKLYNDDSLDFVWIDGDHEKDIVYNDLINFWTKIKKGGTIGGDDIEYVKSDVIRFTEEYGLSVEFGYNSFLIKKDLI